MAKHLSLRQAALKLILTISVSLLLVIGGIDFVLITIQTMQNYKRETANTMEYAVSLIGVDFLEDFTTRLMDIYDNMPEDVKADPFSEEYTSYFMELVNDDFWKVRDIIVKCQDGYGLNGVAIILPDQENERIIFGIDSYDISVAYVPGQWVSKENGDIDTPMEIEKIASSQIRMNLSHGDLNGWIATNYIRIYDSQGNVIAYATSDLDVTDFIIKMRQALVLYIILLLAFVIFLAFYISKRLQKMIIDPIDTLASAAREYTKRDKTEENSGDSFFDSVPVKTGNEIETLWHSLSDMEKDINDTMKRIRTLAKEKEKVAAELNFATNIQAGMLPKEKPAFPDRDEFEVFASMDPAKEVGGDLYDYFLIDDDHLCLVVGDVSGKGVPAALFMVVVTTVIRNIASLDMKISDMMKEINNQMCKHNEEALFVTLWLGIYTISTRHLRMANAGHEYPVLYKASKGKYELYESEHDVPVGVMEDMEYERDELFLEPGDKLFVYTDGVPEATRADDEQYGTERMMSCLNKDTTLDGENTLRTIRQDVDTFIDGADQFDDLTMLYFEVKK